MLLPGNNRAGDFFCRKKTNMEVSQRKLQILHSKEGRKHSFSWKHNNRFPPKANKLPAQALNHQNPSETLQPHCQLRKWVIDVDLNLREERDPAFVYPKIRATLSPDFFFCVVSFHEQGGDTNVQRYRSDRTTWLQGTGCRWGSVKVTIWGRLMGYWCASQTPMKEDITRMGELTSNSNQLSCTSLLPHGGVFRFIESSWNNQSQSRLTSKGNQDFSNECPCHGRPASEGKPQTTRCQRCLGENYMSEELQVNLFDADVDVRLTFNAVTTPKDYTDLFLSVNGTLED